MDIKAVLTELEKYDKAIAKQVEKVLNEGQQIAPQAILRLAVVAEYFKKLSLDEVQRLLDPVAFRDEIEENQAHKKRIGLWTVLRNILSLAPLITTWIGLFLASSAYQQYWASPANAKAPAEPFLQLWQERFHNIALFGFFPFVPTFAEIALADVLLLGFLLLCILRIQFLERRAQQAFDSFSGELRDVTEKLLRVVATEGASSMDRIVKTLDEAYQKGLDQMIKSVKTLDDANTEQIVNALKIVVADTLKASEDVAKQAQKTIEDLNSDLRDLVNKFHDDLGTLSSDLVVYDEQVKKLTDASTKLGNASSDLAANVNDLTKGTQAYADVGKDIRAELGSLNSTQQQLVTKVDNTQQDVATKIASFASNMDSAAKATESAAKELGQFTKADIQKITRSVSLVADRVADAADELVKVQSSLSQVEKDLQASLTQTDSHLQTSLKYLDQHLYTSLVQMNNNLQATGQQLQAAAQALASVKGVTKKKGIRGIFKRP